MIDLRSVVAIPKIQETKKVSIISDFKKGERFTGKIISISDDKTSVTIKLRDGSEFVAKLDIPLKDILDGNVLFEFDGFEEGNLKLKVIKNNSNENNNLKNDSLDIILKNLSLDKSKKPMIEAMIKFNIPLTKENIELLNGLLDFKEKMGNDEQFINKFIDKYLNAKNLDQTQIQGKNIASKLKDFFNEFKNMENKELFMFLENDIDITKENIKSYNNVFKEDCGLYESLKNLDSKLNLSSGIKNLDSNILGKFNEYILNKEIDLGSLEKTNINEIMFKIGEKELELSDDDFQVFKESLKNIDLIKKDELSSKINTSLDKLLFSDKNLFKGKDELIQIKESLREFISLERLDAKEYNSLNKGINTLSKVIENFDSLNTKTITTLKNVLTDIKEVFIKIESSNLNQTASHTKVLADVKPIASDNIDTFLKNLTEVKKSISDSSEDMKSVIKSIANKLIPNNIASENIAGMLKQQINDFKLFNSFNNEYYYLDIPVNIREDKYPCKLIIKDDRRDNKKIDSKNLKLVLSIKTINMGTVDALVKVSDKKLNVEINVEEESVKFVERKSKVLEKTLEQLGFMPYIFVRKQIKKDNDISNYREFFNDSNSLGIDRMV